MKIENIVIACFKRDLFMLRSCVASIRYWYPDIKIYLLKDITSGNFSTTEIEEVFNCEVLETNGKYSGWGFSKFEAFFSKLDKFLLLDADTVFLGHVIDELEKFNNDFIVTGVDGDASQLVVNRDYINIKKTKEFDPSYEYPGYGINTGQVLITKGVVTENDLDQFITKEDGKLKEKHPGLFPHADQGLINYILAKKIAHNEVSVRYHPFWIWPATQDAEKINIEQLKKKKGTPFVLHWAGLKPVNFRRFKRYDILKFYNDIYYSQVPVGKIKWAARTAVSYAFTTLKIAKYKLFRQEYDK